MADDELVRQLAAVLADGSGDVDLFTDDRFAGTHWDSHRQVYLSEAERALSWLAERGRLVPDGATAEEQWGVRLQREAGGIVDHRATRNEAEAREVVRDLLDGGRGVPTDRQAWAWVPSLVRRRRIATPWVAVPDEEATDRG